MAPARNTQWTTCGRKLLLDGKSFFVRGVNYAPTPIGRPGRLDVLDDPTIFLRDLQNLRLMSANAVKTYDYYSTVDHAAYLDAAYNDGDESVYTIFSIWIDQSLMEKSTPTDGKKFQQLVRNYYDMARLTSAHPGIMGYSIGGEMNSVTVVNDADFWDKFKLLTDAVRRGMAENKAHKVITTTFVDDGGLSFAAGEKFGADVDMWGSNVYQTDYPGSVIPKFQAASASKPLLVSEYGFPYASNKGVGDTVQLNMVADMLVQQTLAMQDNFALQDDVGEQVIVGGFVFEYSDEWWKAGNPDEHNLGLVRNGGFPLGFLSEEYFGLFSAQRASEPGQPDVLRPRPTVSLLANIWVDSKLETEGDDYSSVCSLPKLSTSNFKQLTRSSDASSLPFTGVAIMCGVLLVAAAAFVRTQIRRSRYRSLSRGRANGFARMTSKTSLLSVPRAHAAYDEDDIQV